MSVTEDHYLQRIAQHVISYERQVAALTYQRDEGLKKIGELQTEVEELQRTTRDLMLANMAAAGVSSTDSEGTNPPDEVESDVVSETGSEGTPS